MNAFKNKLGEHYLVELFDCDKETLNNVNSLSKSLQEAARLAEATIVQNVSHQFSPYGVTAITVVAESHFALHTWPEHAYAALDIFTCSPNMKQDLAIQYLKEKLSSKRIQQQTINRGLIEQL